MEKIYVIIVLYKCLPDESKAVKSFLEIEKINLDLYNNYEIILYENSCTEFGKILPLECIYIEDIKNSGLSHAYNFAYKKALDNGAKWLLLLDQDTTFEENFLQQQLLAIDRISEDVVAIVPKLIAQNEAIVSPVFTKYGDKRDGKTLLVPGEMDDCYAYNSGSLLQVDFLNNIDGFNEDYKLDMLDHWIYSKIALAKKRVCILDINLRHDLSVIDFEKCVSIERYRLMLESQLRFVYDFRSKSEFKKLKRQLFKRALYQFIYYKNKKFSFITLARALRRWDVKNQ